MRELSLHILDLLQNSIEAGARHITLDINESTSENRLSIRVLDDGRGMHQDTVQRVLDPFFTTRKTREVGLGLALFKAAAERCNGRLVVHSSPGVGTEVTADMELDHIDRAPLGDIPGTILSVLLASETIELVYHHRVDERSFILDTTELRKILGKVPFSEPAVWRWLTSYLSEGYNELYTASEQTEATTGE